MNPLIKATNLLGGLPFPELQKKGRGEGEVVNPYDLSFTWKVKGTDTGFVFAVYEMHIKPGASIPIHVHPYAEFFYVLEGQISVMRLNDRGAIEWIPVSAGECANAPATAPHGIKNRSSESAKFLSVSNYEHEKGFDNYQALLETPAGRSMTQNQKNESLTNLFAEQKITFLDAQEQL